MTGGTEDLDMRKRLIVSIVASIAALISAPGLSLAQTWDSAGLPQSAFVPSPATSAPAPRRDLSGIWDAGSAGISGPGHVASPFTPWAAERLKEMKPGNGPRAVHESEINDPLNTLCDPAGFPRTVLYELRPTQIVQTPNQVLILYLYERRWRVIWTDGRPLPTDPDPRWYGYSVGRWEDDYTFVVQTVGMDERTWLDNAGNPHSADLRVEERYHRVNRDWLELTVTIDDPTAYTKPWTPRNKLPLKMMPPDTDLREWICAASEAAAYRKVVDEQNRLATEKK
jgi:hypothetical protein